MSAAKTCRRCGYYTEASAYEMSYLGSLPLCQCPQPAPLPVFRSGPGIERKRPPYRPTPVLSANDQAIVDGIANNSGIEVLTKANVTAMVDNIKAVVDTIIGNGPPAETVETVESVEVLTKADYRTVMLEGDGMTRPVYVPATEVNDSCLACWPAPCADSHQAGKTMKVTCRSCGDDAHPGKCRKPLFGNVTVKPNSQRPELDQMHPAKPMGWTCPRCHVVNAPWIERCSCPPKPQTLVIRGGRTTILT